MLIYTICAIMVISGAALLIVMLTRKKASAPKKLAGPDGTSDDIGPTD